MVILACEDFWVEHMMAEELGIHVISYDDDTDNDNTNNNDINNANNTI